MKGSIEKYLEDLGAKLPSPGGGSVAALTSALSAGLASMVCNFTIGNPKFPDSQTEMKGMLSSVTQIRGSLCRLVDDDVQAYAQLSAAYKLPKETDEEKLKRERVIQQALSRAIEIPFTILQLSYRLLEETIRLLEKGNPGLLTDTAMAAILAYSGIESAKLNIEINLPGIKDKDIKAKLRGKIKPLIREGRKIRDEVVKRAEKLMAKNT